MLNTRPIAKCFLSIIAAVAVAASAVAGDAPPSSTKKRPVKQPQSEVQQGVWVTKVSSFVYRDLTSKFTCKALESQIKDVLQLLGASKTNLGAHSLSRPGAANTGNRDTAGSALLGSAERFSLLSGKNPNGREYPYPMAVL